MLFVRIGTASKPADSRHARLVELFAAAQKTEFYRLWLRTISDRPEHEFDLLPEVELGRFEENTDLFCNRRAPRPALYDLRYPIQPMPRIAVFADGFRRTGLVRPIAPDKISSLRAFKPETFAAPMKVLRQVAEAGFAPQFPLIVFSGVRDGCLTDEDRDFLWKAFGVPAFEQFAGLNSEVLAEECEAHEGLHIRSSDSIFEMRGQELIVSSLINYRHPVIRLRTGLTASLKQTLCSCGRPGPRIMNMADLALVQYRPRVLAATG